MNVVRRLRTIAVAAAWLTLGALAADAQTVVKPGFNLFTTNQDIQIGSQSAAKVEQQMPMFTDAQAQRYVETLGSRLAAKAPGAKYPYRFRVVNLSDVNAFALPGGFIYVHRGLLERVHSEGELAGVMAHEIAHVALRHPTNQVSKAYLAQAGLGILGGLLGGRSQNTGQIINTVGGFGLNSLFLRFSRTMESQADIVGSQIMARAGYDPVEMAHFFHYLGQQAGGNPTKLATFFSDHPSPANREARVIQEAQLIGRVQPAPGIGNLAAVQSQVRGYPPAPTMAQLAARQGGGSTGTTSTDQPQTTVSIEPPSGRFRQFAHRSGLYRVDQPDNWNDYVASSGYGVTIAPRNGLVAASDGRQMLVSGVIINHYVPFGGSVAGQSFDANGSLFGDSDLEQATSDLVRNIRRGNTYLSVSSQQRRTISGRPAMVVRLAGQSGVTGEDERVTVVTRELPDQHIVYMLLVAPSKDYASLTPTFDRMVQSFTVNENAHI